jgi:hypothetical protein
MCHKKEELEMPRVHRRAPPSTTPNRPRRSARPGVLTEPAAAGIARMLARWAVGIRIQQKRRA